MGKVDLVPLYIVVAVYYRKIWVSGWGRTLRMGFSVDTPGGPF